VVATLIGRSPEGRFQATADNGLVQGIGALLPRPIVVERGAWKAPSHPPYINQRKPAGAPKRFDGSASCGPTCMAMLARWIGYGRELTDFQLIVRFSGIGATTMEEGTETEGIVAIARELGRRAHVYRGCDLEKMRSALARGSAVIANGEYYVMPPHEDPTLREGHWILVYGIAPNGDFLVHDSEDPLVETVTPYTMRRYLREHDKGGVQVEVELARAAVALVRGHLPR
jgi:hypothetical protein